MRFNGSIKNISLITKFTASLSSLGGNAWVRLDNDQVRFTILPERGTEVWALLSIDSVFGAYHIQSASPNNTINLEVPIEPLHRALKSAYAASSASLRLTKKDNVPLLALTIIKTTISNAAPAGDLRLSGNVDDGSNTGARDSSVSFGAGGMALETIVTQNVPVRVLGAARVEGLHEPRYPEPDVHILLPSLAQIKAVSDRFTRIASGTRVAAGGTASLTGSVPRLELSANMHGRLRLRIVTDALSISSVWTDLKNPELDPTQIEGGEEGIRNHPSTRMREAGGRDGEDEAGWATVRLDGRNWGKVLSVGQLGGRVIACFIHEKALILYAYISHDDRHEESVLTYYMSSYSS